jgi:hypothetical protein
MHRKLLSSVREKQCERNMLSEIFGCISIDIYFCIHFVMSRVITIWVRQN